MKLAVLSFLVILVLLLSVAALLLWRRGARRGLYDRHPLLLSAAERAFYGALLAAIGSRYFVAPKVRVADVLRPNARLSKKVAMLARNRISQKHFDFVLCHPDTFAIVAAVELDDKSHEQGRRKARDRFLDASAKGAELPLVRVRAQASYTPAEVADALGALLAPSGGPSSGAATSGPTHVRKGLQKGPAPGREAAGPATRPPRSPPRRPAPPSRPAPSSTEAD